MPIKSDSEAKGEVVSVDKIPADKMIVDIGPETIEKFRRGLLGSQDGILERPGGGGGNTAVCPGNQSAG